MFRIGTYSRIPDKFPTMRQIVPTIILHMQKNKRIVILNTYRDNKDEMDTRVRHLELMVRLLCLAVALISIALIL